MTVLQKMFIIVAITYHTCAIVSGTRRPTVMPTDESNDCNCDVLQITGPDGFCHNFTKQNEKLNGKPYFFSMKRNMISWDNGQWSYDKYNSSLNTFVTQKKFDPKSFSFELLCKKISHTLWITLNANLNK